MQEQPAGELASIALDQWRSKHFKECLDTLSTLESQVELGGDVSAPASNGEKEPSAAESSITVQQIKYNQTLAEFAHQTERKPATTQRANLLLNSFSDFIKAAKETIPDQGGSAQGSNDLDVTVQVGSTTLALMLYNCSVVYVHLGKFQTAMQILESIFKCLDHADQVNDSLLLRVCFLLLDLYTRNGWGMSSKPLSQIVSKCNAVIQYLEEPHEFNSSVASSDAAGSGGNKTGEIDDSGQLDKESVEFKFRLHLYKAKVQLLQRKVSGSRKEVKSALEIFQHELKPSWPMDTVSGSNSFKGGSQSTPTWLDLGFQLEDPFPGPGAEVPGAVFNTPALVLKANLEYLRENYKKSLKLLTSCSRAGLHSGIFYNNVACVHHNLKQHQCATLYLTKALRSFRESNGPGMVTVGQHQHAKVLFNLGLQLLQTRKPQLAYSCFVEASPQLYNQPRLWLRLAESVVMAFEQGLLQGAKDLGSDDNGTSGGGCTARSLVHTSLKEGGESRVHINMVGSNPLHPSSFSKTARTSSALRDALDGAGPVSALLPGARRQREQLLREHAPSPEAEPAEPVRETIGLESAPTRLGSFETLRNTVGPLSLEVGLQSTYNVTHLLDAEDGIQSSVPAGDIVENGNEEDHADSEEEGQVSAPPAGTLEAVGDQVRLAALLARSYLALSIGHSALAAKAAGEYLAIVKVPKSANAMMRGERESLAHTYLAEALLMQGEVETAAEHIEKAYTVSGGQNTSLATENSGKEDPIGSVSQEMLVRSSFCTNLATIHIAQGKMVLAEKALLQALHLVPHSNDALRGLLFLYLKNGNISAALQVLRTKRVVPLTSN